MQTIDEIFAAMPAEAAAVDYEYLVIDPVARTITVPESEKVFGVESDGNAARKYFRCPRYVGDNLDLAAMFLTVNFRNANGEEDGYLVDDVAVQGEFVTFSWELWPKVTAYKGPVQFAVCADLPNTAEKKRPDWNTTLAEGDVLEGLDPDRGDVEGGTNDAMTQLRAEIAASTAAVEATGAAQVQTVKAAAAAAGAAAETEIEAKGAATLATIPDDYTALAARVGLLTQEKADAYMVATEVAASHEIHAQSCTLQASVQGATSQEGDGDPTLENVRQITGVGFDAMKKLTGNETAWRLGANNKAGTATLVHLFIAGGIKTVGCDKLPSVDGTSASWESAPAGRMVQTVDYAVFAVPGAGKTLEQCKAWVAELSPTVWYINTTHSPGDPYYVGLGTEDTAGNYRGVAAEVGPVPLFDGDTVEPWVRSGCDVKVVLDGTEEWSKYGDQYFVLYGMAEAAKPYTGYGSHYPYKYDYATKSIFVGLNVLYCGTELMNVYGGNVESWKNYLAAQYAAGTPVTIWYRSVNYTRENDLPLCRVTRDKRRLVLTGTETLGVNTHGNGMPYMVYVSKGAKTAAAPVCSHYIGETWSDQDGHVHIINGNVVMTDSRYVDKTTAVALVAEQYNAGTPITIICKLERPEVYAFDAAVLQSLRSLPEIVTASGLLSVTYPQDIAYTIQRLVAAIQALGGAI